MKKFLCLFLCLLLLSGCTTHSRRNHGKPNFPTLTLPTETEDADLWLVFPPSIYKSGDKLRLYFCMADEDNPWIGELRDWRVMNFSITYAMLN